MSGADAVFAALPGLPAPSVAVLEALAHAAAERGDGAAREALARALSEEPPAGAPLSSLAARARLAWELHALDGTGRERAESLTARLLGRRGEDGAFREADGPVRPAEGNARAALALLRAEAFGTAGAREAADGALRFLQESLYDPLLGLVHARGGGGDEEHGVLADAAWTARAFAESFLAGGGKARRDFADALMRFLFQELWERGGGGFLERIQRPGRPAPSVDPVANGAALEACWLLHHLMGNANYRRWIDWGLAGAWPMGREDPASLASLARAADLAARGRAHFELVGRLEDPRAAALLGALRRLCRARAIVSFVDPDDQDYILAHRLEGAPPRLFACGPDLRPLASAGSPEEVPAAAGALLGRAPA